MDASIDPTEGTTGNPAADDVEGHKFYYKSDAEVKSGVEPLDGRAADEEPAEDDVEGHSRYR